MATFRENTYFNLNFLMLEDVVANTRVPSD